MKLRREPPRLKESERQKDKTPRSQEKINKILLKELKKSKSHKLTYNQIKQLVGIDETIQMVPYATPLLKDGLIEKWEDCGKVRIDDNDFSGYRLTAKGVSYQSARTKDEMKFWLEILLPCAATIFGVLLASVLK